MTMESPSFLTVCLNPTLQKTLLFSRFEPGEVNRATSHHYDASGKGINVTRVLTQLGGRAVHLTHLGRQARDFIRLLGPDHLTVEWVDSDSEIRTCTTVVDRSAHLTTELVEESEPVSAGTGDRLMQAFRRLVFECDWLVISGTRAGGYSDSVFPSMIRMAKDLGKKVICDYRGEDLQLSLPERPDYIKPNWKEFTDTFFSGGLTEGDADKAVHHKMLDIAQQFDTTVILTRGAGEVAFTEGGKIKKIHPDRVEPVNTTGCGDSFTAGLAWSLSQGEPLTDAVRMGIRCGMRCALSVRPGVIF
jgi:1-phosphofructokinase/tagatose 6-phosphate kinase